MDEPKEDLAAERLELCGSLDELRGGAALVSQPARQSDKVELRPFGAIERARAATPGSPGLPLCGRRDGA